MTRRHSNAFQAQTALAQEDNIIQLILTRNPLIRLIHRNLGGPKSILELEQFLYGAYTPNHPAVLDGAVDAGVVSSPSVIVVVPSLTTVLVI